MRDSERPTAIHIDGCHGVTLTNNTGIGDMDLISAKNSSNIKGSGNKLINEPTYSNESLKINNVDETLPDKSFFEKFWIPLFMVVIAAVIAISYDQYKVQGSNSEQKQQEKQR